MAHGGVLRWRQRERGSRGDPSRQGLLQPDLQLAFLLAMETSAPTLTLAAGDHTLVFWLVDGPDADVRWCRVSLLVSGQEEPLGAEALHVLARRIASVLIERPTERRWMFTLSGRYSSLYGVCRPEGWTLLLQDGYAVAIAELRLSSEEAARWLVKLEALRRERDDEGRDHRSPEHGTSRPKTVFIGAPLAGKATCVVALARVLGGKIQERNLTRDDHPFGHERAMGFSVSNNRFRGECWTIRGTPWLSASWDELLAEAQSVVLVIDGHAQREEANAQAIAQVANRQPSFPRGRIVLTKSDIVGLKEAWRQRDRLLSRTPTLAAWPTYVHTAATSDRERARDLVPGFV